MASFSSESNETSNKGRLSRLLTPRRVFWLVIGAMVVTALLGLLTIGIYKLGVDAQRGRIARIEQLGGHIVDLGDVELDPAAALTPGKVLGPTWDPPPTTGLSIDQPAGPTFPSVVEEASYFRGLQGIRLEGAPLTDDQLKSLINPRTLRALVIPGTDISDRGVEWLAKCSRLEFLDLRVSQVSDKAIASLAKIKTLNRVDLRHTRVTAAGVARLQTALPNAQIFGATAPNEAHLTVLRDIGRRGGLWQSREYYDGLQENIGVAFDRYGSWSDFDWTTLKAIDGLSCVYIEVPTPTTALITIAEVTTIKRLILDTLKLDDADIEQIGRMKTLELLSLYDCKLDWSLMREKLNGLQNLQSLTPQGMPIDSASLKTFAGLPNLTHLYLTNGPFKQRNGPCDNEALAQDGLPRQIEFLELSDSQLTDRGLQAIRECRSLKYLRLEHTKVTDASAAMLLSLPALQIVDLQGSAMSQAKMDEIGRELNLRAEARLRGQ